MPRTAPPALAALSLSVQPLGDGAQLLIPDGQFRSSDGSGRPEGVPGWRLDAQLAERIIAARRERGVKIVVDYEHATLTRAKEGLPAPAAGWIDPAHLEYRPGVGLVATEVEWTTTAAGHLAAREYGYGSPVFPYDPTTGDVTGLHSFALTNDPGLTGVNTALSALTAATSQETPEVNETLKKLLAALGLPEAASEAEATAAIAALKAKADAAAVEVAALKAAVPAAPDPAKYVPVQVVADMQQQLAALTGRMAEDEAGRLIEQAIGQGKLVEAQRAWAAELGKKDIAALRAYVASAPAIAALAGMQTAGTDPAATAAALTPAELAVCQAMGLSEADYRKTKETK